MYPNQMVAYKPEPTLYGPMKVKEIRLGNVLCITQEETYTTSEKTELFLATELEDASKVFIPVGAGPVTAPVVPDTIPDNF
jgi:hypothetical protein